jgi:hypothetical protein
MLWRIESISVKGHNSLQKSTNRKILTTCTSGHHHLALCQVSVEKCRRSCGFRHTHTHNLYPELSFLGTHQGELFLVAHPRLICDNTADVLPSWCINHAGRQSGNRVTWTSWIRCVNRVNPSRETCESVTRTMWICHVNRVNQSHESCESCESETWIM